MNIKDEKNTAETKPSYKTDFFLVAMLLVIALGTPAYLGYRESQYRKEIYATSVISLIENKEKYKDEYYLFSFIPTYSDLLNQSESAKLYGCQKEETILKEKLQSITLSEYWKVLENIQQCKEEKAKEKLVMKE